MKWTTATLALFSVGTLLLTGKVLLRPNRATPSEILDGVQAARERGITDTALLLRDLDRAVRDSASDASEPADPNLAVQLLRCRAELRAHLGDYKTAMEDLDTALALDTEAEAGLSHLKLVYQAEDGDRSGALLAALTLRDRFPKFLQAHTLAGTLASEEAAAALQQAIAKTDETLLREDSVSARPLLATIAARVTGADPERARQATPLRGLFLPKHRMELQQVLVLLDEASRLNSQARRNLARGVADEGDSAARVLLLELYMAAGQNQLAADLGSTLLLQPSASHSEPIFRLTFQSLLRIGQSARALRLVQNLDWAKVRPGSELCLEVADFLFEHHAWGQLSQVSARLTALQDRTTVSAARFYDGFAYSAQEKWPQAAKALIEFKRLKQNTGPVPYARPRADLQLAHIYRRLAESAEDTSPATNPVQIAKWHQLEFEHLGAALGTSVLAAHPGWLEEIDAEDFIRFKDAGLEIAQRKKEENDDEYVGYRKPEEYFTHALSLNPKKTQEWKEEWGQIGAASLKATGHRLPKLMASMQTQGRSMPNVDVGPWALLQLAEDHLQRGNPTAAMTVARELLETYPHLLPALDVLIRSQLVRGSREEVLDEILLRIQLVGGDSTSSGFLDRVGAQELPPDQRKRLILQDPSNRGRIEVAQHLLEAEQPARALVALTPQLLPDAKEGEEPTWETLSPTLQLLRARALGDLGRYEEASTIWTTLLDNPVLGPEALVFLVEAQLGSGQGDALEPMVTLLLDALARLTPGGRIAALRVADHLLAGGQPALAERLLNGMDAVPDLRGGDILERLALGAAQRGDTQALELILERAEAFLSNGGAETIRILYAIENRLWPQLPSLVAALRASDFQPNPLSHTILCLLEERLETGWEQARSGADAHPQSGLWAIVQGAAQSLMDAPISLSGSMGKTGEADMAVFLRGTEGARQDPRAALGLLLAIERQGWATWALPRLLEMGQKGGGVLWPTYLGGRAHDSLGQLEQSQNLYTLLTESYPGFIPGWIGLEDQQLAITGSPISDEVMAVRARRSRIPGRKGGGDSLEEALNEAGRLHLAGKNKQAIKGLTEALVPGGENQGDARTFLARLLHSQGSYSQAAVEYALALVSVPSNPGHPLLKEYLNTLQRASDENLPDEARIDLASLEVLLNAQALHFPSDPLVPYEQARLGLRLENRNPALASDLVSTLFTQFRKATRQTPLNDLRAGSAGDWARLLTRVRPDLALEFITADLEVHPGDIDLWHNYADLLAVRGEFAEERALREALVRMCPEAGALQDLAWILLRMGSPLRLVNSYLLKAQQAGGSSSQSALNDRANFIRNLANINRADGRGVDRGALRNLQKLWARREKLRTVDLPILGKQYALGLLRHGEQDDLAALPQVLTELRSLPQCDPYTRELAVALEGLSR